MDTCKRWWGNKHNFGKWEIDRRQYIYENHIVLGEIVKLNTGELFIQKRKCQNCNLAEFNKQVIEI